ncbi:ABC-type nitrate/sulfonate/bicarbonate transport system, periplasmic component [Gottschalkia purinilytica]|uniref:ABC-type nitrate/sulfonate/bicarbonate transport system, periplasmic component n=1 Tax=Gottschalkia purinilytica TaxID=1503 RepID=A0A0L0W995_GOTPU|nr:ABC transporter substrate-binding protein [Gottschalkia purinilytica]KNF08114.1 ABC-type nitrate/sulfonate/bicarbonate transport system, periplasmic component [Gottschalkia purinilytica]
MTKRQKIIGIVMIFILLISLLAGCNNKAKNTTADEVEKRQDKISNLKVGFNPATGNLLCFIAEDKGFFKEEGLKVELVSFTSTTDGLNALNAGKIDMGITFGTAAPLTFMAKGPDLTFFGGYLSGGHPIYAKPEIAKTFKGIESYKNKKVATARLYTPDIVWRTAMNKAGIDINKDLEVIEMKKPTDVLEAVKAGKADVGIGTGSTYAKAKQSGLDIVSWSNDLWDNHVCCRPVAKTEFINNNSDTIVAFLRALIKAEKVFNEDKEFAVSVNQKYLKLDENMAREFTLDTNQIIESDPRKNGIIEMWETMKNLNFIESDMDVNKHINIDLYKKALDQLKLENPNEPFYEKLEKRFDEYNF